MSLTEYVVVTMPEAEVREVLKHARNLYPGNENAALLRTVEFNPRPRPGPMLRYASQRIEVIDRGPKRNSTTADANQPQLF